ncbi:RNA-binding domain superfamily, partial [Sesbania bispinosa]
MAVSDGAAPTPQMVGNAFVEQYYSILHQEPDQVHRFYHETSVLSRPEEDGTMTMVSTIADINKKILSLDYTSFRVEILSADAQPSYKEGVMVVVTGCLTGSDNLKRKFAQSFFLAPQDKGYFVLNDVFRYVDEYKSVDIESVPANDADESAPTDTFVPEPEPTHVPEEIPPSQTAIVDADTGISKEVNQPLENGKLSVTEKVNALKDNAAPFHVRTSPVKPVEQPRVSSIPAPEAPAPSTDSPTEKNNENAGKAYAIFVANLPMNATVEQLERVFKKFGPIKHDGIQVRSNKQQGSCFGFVEFESAASMQSALE